MSATFRKHVRLHVRTTLFHRSATNDITQLDEVVRTARESACLKAQYFVCEESDHPGIVRSGLTDDDKRKLLSQMSFSVEYGCGILHRFKEDGTVIWFGNEDFANLLQKSLYDISCPGWCGVLEEVKEPYNDIVTVCQLTHASTYTAAFQIAWVSRLLAHLYLITDLITASLRREVLSRDDTTDPPNV